MITIECSIIGCTQYAEWKRASHTLDEDYLCNTHWHALRVHVPQSASDYVGIHISRARGNPVLDRLGDEIAYDGAPPSRI